MNMQFFTKLFITIVHTYTFSYYYYIINKFTFAKVFVTMNIHYYIHLSEYYLCIFMINRYFID